MEFTPTRAAGLARLAAFLPRAGRDYARDRNADGGPEARENVSGLSPYLRRRLVTEEEVVRAVDERHGTGAFKFVAEVFWRTYFKGWLEQRPEVWLRYDAAVRARAQDLAADIALHDAYAAAVNGRTGIDAFDAWNAELIATGYLHNHVRMWYASIWIFTLRLPWQLGADHFLRHLLDGDPASNTLSWRWVAGLHTRGRTYLARRDNIRRYTGGRFDPDGLAARAVAPPDEGNPPRRELPRADEPPAADALLLLHDDDLGVESVPVGDARIVEVAILDASDALTPDGLTPLPRAFIDGAVDDTLARAPLRFGVQAARATPRVVAERVRRLGVRDVVAPYAPVGPAAEWIAALRTTLAHDGVTVHRVRRAWDDAAWPYATGGYFTLGTRVPKLLADAGIRRSAAC